MQPTFSERSARAPFRQASHNTGRTFHVFDVILPDNDGTGVPYFPRRPRVKITAIETILLDEFPNLLWVQIHTDTGHVGIGETFYGARAVEAHIHETLV